MLLLVFALFIFTYLLMKVKKKSPAYTAHTPS